MSRLQILESLVDESHHSKRICGDKVHSIIIECL